MADQYTPKTEQVRRYWQYGANAWADGVARDDDMHPVDGSIGEEFDRWLAARDAQVLRDAADALDASASRMDPKHPIELSYINCTRIDAQELRHRADRIEGGTSA